jgi:hypothetical protein
MEGLKFVNTKLGAHLFDLSIRNKREHDMVESYIKLTPYDQCSFRMYCEKNNLIHHYKQKDHIY